MSRDPSMEQTATGLMTTRGIETSFSFTSYEKQILRDLAMRMAELAARPEEGEKKKLWYALNDLHDARPLVFCDPENGWNEIITQEMILCTDPLARVWEMHLRKEIFHGEEMKDDKVIEACFNVPYNYHDSGWGLNHTVIGQEGRESDGGSITWDSPIKEWERDFENLRFPEITVDYKKTESVLALAEEVFGDLLEVRLKGVWWWTLGMTWDFINLRGLSNFMMDLYDNPEWVHRLMNFLKEGNLAKLKFLEEEGLLSLNNDGTYVGSGGFGWTGQLSVEAGHKVQTRDMWGFTESQETLGISTEMFSEFVFPYQKAIQERFGLNCYGCCEPIDPRWSVIRTVPNLRRVSVSPWADIDKMAEYLEDRYVFSMKPSPAPLAQPDINEEAIRSELKSNLGKARKCHIEIIMKDNHTIGNNPDNIRRWCRIAKEEAMSL